jgi:hypothetical protein
LLPVGISIPYIAVSVVGFVIMLASCYWAAMSYRRMNGLAAGRIQLKDRRAGRRDKGGPKDKAGSKDKAGPKDKGRGKRSGTGLSERLEERWRRRQEGRDG